MDHLDDDRAFAHAGGHAFHRGVAHIAGRENTGNAGFEQIGIAIQGPAFGARAAGRKGGAGENEAVFVHGDHAFQPVGAGRGADKDKEATRIEEVDSAGPVVDDGNLFEMVRAAGLLNFRKRTDFDVGCPGNLINQILRHGGGERIPAHGHDDAASVAGEEHGGLSG